jgi:hypothetical protein
MAIAPNDVECATATLRCKDLRQNGPVTAKLRCHWVSLMRAVASIISMLMACRSCHARQQKRSETRMPQTTPH